MEKIEGLFKKFVYTGVGLVSLTKDKLKKTIEEMVKEEKITTKEGEKIVNDFLKNSKTKKKELEKNLKDIAEKAMSKFNFAKTKELKKLNKRVKALEEVLDKE